VVREGVVNFHPRQMLLQELPQMAAVSLRVHLDPSMGALHDAGEEELHGRGWGLGIRD
jgi:hypothetical protein